MTIHDAALAATWERRQRDLREVQHSPQFHVDAKSSCRLIGGRGDRPTVTGIAIDVTDVPSDMRATTRYQWMPSVFGVTVNVFAFAGNSASCE
jgi:hypothetical protein